MPSRRARRRTDKGRSRRQRLAGAVPDHPITMIVLIGYGVALGCIFGAYILHGGNIGVILHALPTELMAILGGSLGAFAVNNQPKVLKATLPAIPGRAQGLEVLEGALHGADGAALRHPAEGPQGRPDGDREGRRGPASLADLPEVHGRRRRPPRRRVHHRLPAHDGLGQPQLARDRKPDGQRDRDPPRRGARPGQRARPAWPAPCRPSASSRRCSAWSTRWARSASRRRSSAA